MSFWDRLTSKSRILRLEHAMTEVERAVQELEREVDGLRRERRESSGG